MDTLANSVIFPRGEENTAFGQYFIGKSYLQMLALPEGGVNIPIGNVTFEPGCRNNWHKHPGGQILLVTGGRGWYQAWEEPARELHAGDVVVIPCGVKHWHGAAKDSWFVHIAIEGDAAAGPSEWLEPVGSDVYLQLP